MGKLRAAVVGVGYLGSFHAEKYHNLPEVDLVAVVDSQKESAELVAKRFNTEPFTDHKQILDKVDLVSVVVPTEHHYEVAKDFLDAGVHMLLEKPITHSLARAEGLIELAANKNVVLQVGHVERFNPAIRMMYEKIKNPAFIEVHRLAPFNRRGTDVDVVLDLMIHDIDIVLSMVNSPLVDVHPVGTSVLTDHVDIANAHLRFENDCVANITASRVSTNKMRKIRVFEHDTYISVDCGERKLQLYTKLPIQDPASDESLSINIEEHNFEATDQLLEEIRAFIDSVQQGTAPLVPGEAGKRALEVALEISERIKSSKNYHGKGATSMVD